MTLGGHLRPVRPAEPGYVASPVWRYGAAAGLSLLIATAALNGTSIQIHGLSVYPEYLAIGVVLAWGAAAITLGRLEWYLPRLLVPLGVWLGAELLATLLFAPDRHHSLILWIKLPLMVITYLAVANLARGRIGFAVGTQCLVAAIVALLGISAYASWKLTGSHLGMQHPGRNLGKSWLPAGSLREPDIFGSYLVAAALLALPVVLFLQRTRDRLRTVGWAVVGLAVAGIVLSGSRTAWLALLAGLCVPLAFVVAARPRAALRRALLPALALAAGIIALLALHVNPTSALPAFNPHQNGDLVQRAVSFGSLSRDHNIVARIEIARNALAHWRTHPLTGWGVGAYGEVYTTPPPDTSQAGWISNLPLHLLYDSGLFGLIAFAAAMVMAARRGVAAWLATWGLMRASLAGVLLALFGLLVAYPWIYLGLLEAATRSLPGRRIPALEIVS